MWECSAERADIPRPGARHYELPGSRYCTFDLGRAYGRDSDEEPAQFWSVRWSAAQPLLRGARLGRHCEAFAIAGAALWMEAWINADFGVGAVAGPWHGEQLTKLLFLAREARCARKTIGRTALCKKFSGVVPGLHTGHACSAWRPRAARAAAVPRSAIAA